MAPVLPRRLGKRSLLGARVAPAPARILPEPSALPPASRRDPGSPPGQPQVLPTPLDEQLPAFPAPSLPGAGIPERSVSCSIDVPKRSWEAAVEMDEMVAALVLTSLSCSPALRSPPSQGAGDPWKDSGDISDSGSSTTSGHWSSAGSATASPPHCPSSATASPPHCPSSATASPPHCPSSATASPPHCPSSATPSPPHCPSSATPSPPHCPSSATASPLPCPDAATVCHPHCPSSVTMSPPHYPGSVTMSPPHHAGSATASLPCYPGSATASPPHCPGSATVSPPHHAGSATASLPRCPCAATASPLSDNGFDTDPEPWLPEEPAPRRRKNSARLAFKCLWPGCGKVLRSGVGIKRHVRTRHLGEGSEREEDFYYTELRVPEEPPPELPPPAVPAVPAVPGATAVPDASGAVSCSAPIVIQPGPGQPGLSHSAPGSFWHIQADHAYQALPSIQIPVSPHIFTSISWAAATSPLPSLSPARSRSLSLSDPQPPQPPPLLPPRLLVASPPRASLNTRKIRGEAKKCRKVYGIEHREQWCTACRWKKACQRFLD